MHMYNPGVCVDLTQNDCEVSFACRVADTMKYVQHTHRLTYTEWALMTNTHMPLPHKGSVGQQTDW